MNAIANRILRIVWMSLAISSYANIAICADMEMSKSGKGVLSAVTYTGDDASGRLVLVREA